ncbi:MAG: sulfotransferase domain-containing protein [Candidatus Omnitrophica bacterium]|nr:sulfotransferase domain-containing protein [Candidatus Omnitrophota bacterium]
MPEKQDQVILIADFGRSGQGWLSYMLCYILNASFIEPYVLLKGQQYTASEHILSLTRGHLPGREKTPYAMVVKTHEYPSVDINLTDKIICLTRDPRDVAVSYYNMQVVNSKKIKNWKNVLLNRKLIHYSRTALKWTKYYQCWQGKDCYWVRYEDMITDLKNTLKGILAYLGIEAKEEILKEAMEEFSFAKITGRTPGVEDKKNLEFRKGIMGDYKNHFNKLEMKLFSQICSKVASEHGYIL